MQNAWDTTQLTMPLALGYLKSFALSDEHIARNFDIQIYNFSRRASVSHMALELMEDPPDILAFSVLGWNFQNFGQLAETFRQVRPEHRGWSIFGGVHVSHQSDRVFRLYPCVDMVVNGEGELTFRDLLLDFLAGTKKEELAHVPGLSVRREDGTVYHTEARPRLLDLDQIPSPFLTGAIPLRDRNGRFLYDVALMETNRGCPYKCAFCYWGGATGQKLARFSEERVTEELEFFVKNEIEHIALCDANFGMLKEDRRFVENMVRLRAETTYPRSFIASWAKNKSSTFYEIVHRLKETGFHSDFTLSLQTLNDDALASMNRKNMKLNAFDDLCRWLEKEEMSAHVELIWGLPGETCESFVEGYDRIAAWHPRIATYPLIILPNTSYFDQRDEYGLVTVRDTVSDFEFVLSHDTISLEDNRRMHAFLFWARLMAEYQVLRLVWRPLLHLAGVKQSEVIWSLKRWFERQDDPASAGLLGYLESVVDNFDITRITAGVIYVHRQAEAFEPLFARWWREEIAPRIPEERRAFFADLFRYDWLTRPRSDHACGADMRAIELEGERFYGPISQLFGHNIPAVLDDLRRDRDVQITPEPWEATLYFRAGFDDVADSHEFVPRYVGLSWEMIEEEAERRRWGLETTNVQPHVVGLNLSETPALENPRLKVLQAAGNGEE